jgi:hypothetical protein
MEFVAVTLIRYLFARFEVLTEVMMKVQVFRNLSP